ncbi:MAG: NeuD/PglB/VioB family sugar acetyltransferase [Actinomycetia bacterium]|nr:NeuD/PglB/VioB family sugar acetyltransferase [Actinomycetes bacterium]
MSSTPKVLGQIVAPLINPNEPEAQVVEIAVEHSSHVVQGTAVCTLETSKATVVVESHLEGYVGGLRVTLDERVTAGDVICELYESAPAASQVTARPAVATPRGLKMTRKAERLARENDVDLSLLPTHRFVTEADVQALIEEAAGEVELDEGLSAAVHDLTAVIFGAGGHAKSLIELLRAGDELEPLCVLDDQPGERTELLGVPILGGREYLSPLRSAGLRLALNAVGAIGRMHERAAIFDVLRAEGFELATVVDPGASVASSARLEPGVQVFAGVVIGADARIGRGVIINSGAVVSHDCVIGEYSHIAPGAILAGEVEVGGEVLVGMGVTAPVGLRIGAGAIVGNGCVLRADVASGTIISAGTVWPPAERSS